MHGKEARREVQGLKEAAWGGGTSAGVGGRYQSVSPAGLLISCVTSANSLCFSSHPPTHRAAERPG